MKDPEKKVNRKENVKDEKSLENQCFQGQLVRSTGLEPVLG